MRGKRARQLRRMAEANTVGAPKKRYFQIERSGVVGLKPGCTRYEYKQLKKDYKEGRQ